MSPADATHWDARYAAGSPWGTEPNRTVREAVTGLTPGRARDVAAGDGRHALWLAAAGWQVDALDFSPTAVDRGRASTALLDGEGALPGSVHWEVADATVARPEPLAYDLVLHSYLHLPGESALAALRLSASGVAPGGVFLLVGHDESNLEHGHGGPQDPDVLTAVEPITRALTAAGLVVERAEVVERPVDGAPRPALDTVVVARRPAS
ncbi:class I SAM-dependent methyltransferase [Actinotalea sp.]|uniref:class I SAM-dependent methyltransferase n=1 Tax=Actinotalea sp. TaxID=1872145 RepID=UPI003566FD28